MTLMLLFVIIIVPELLEFLHKTSTLYIVYVLNKLYHQSMQTQRRAALNMHKGRHEIIRQIVEV